MTRIKSLLSVAMASVALVSVTANAESSLKIQSPSDKHTLVRLNPEERYLILPVEEAVPDSKIDVMVNGKIEKTFYVRLAEHDIDYTVPLDLQPFMGKGEIMLSVEAYDHYKPFHEKDALLGYPKAPFAWENASFSDTFDTTNVERYRPLYHHTPTYGWMNDPNGMFYKDGVWHLYFQYNPYGSKWQNMTWGHSTSKDLIHWEQQPNAIEMNDLGSIFSGSCAIDVNNTAGFGENEVIAMYTSAGRDQLQSLAYSSDNGMTFTNYNGNPVIVTPKEARDPNMFWNPEINAWNLILAGAEDFEMHLFSSPDLKEWKYESSFGKGYGSQEGVWECPDLFPLKAPDGTTKWVLLSNLNPGGKFGGSATQYFVGDFDGHEFKSDYAKTDTIWMDYGKDHYATVTWSDAPNGRRTAIGWMSNWEYANDVPTKQFRSANTLPRELSLFQAPDGMLKLASAPVPELENLRGDKKSYGTINLAAGASKKYALPEFQGREIVLSYDLQGTTKLEITVSNADGERVVMEVDAEDMEFTMDRRHNGFNNFSSHFPAVTWAPLNREEAKGTLRIFMDTSSIEAFDSEGRFVMTNLVFPEQPYTDLTIKAVGGKAKVENLTIYTLTK